MSETTARPRWPESQCDPSCDAPHVKRLIERLSEPEPRQWGVWCESPVMGRAAWLKKKGETEQFGTKGEAEQRGVEVAASMQNSASYTARRIER